MSSKLLVDTEEAIDAYNKTIEYGEDYMSGWPLVEKGDALGSLGRHEEALKTYEVATEKYPSYHFAWYKKGNALQDLGRYEDAMIAYDNAIETESESPASNVSGFSSSPWKAKGDCLMVLKKYEEAVEAYDRAIKLYPSYPGAWQGKGDALKKLGRSNEANNAYSKAKEIKYSGKIYKMRLLHNLSAGDLA